MTSSRFNLDSTSKTLNLSFLQFNERFGFQNIVPHFEPFFTDITNVRVGSPLHLFSSKTM